EVQALTPELSESFGLLDSPGILVAGVYRDGPAAKAGLKPGDVILKIANEDALDGRTSMNQVALMMPGHEIKLQILRNGKPQELTATIGVRPPSD
ncbi:MAG: PDZ domain-containing protein, partial [Gammaproteobacteria bacterium]|nr:PDZ domain-containing protein [Gammaproteobacteria bacterium]